MKNLEEAVAENAKGILASTMKEEIKELVKESLTEQDDEIETEVETDDEMETPEMGDLMGSEDEMDNEDDMDSEMDMEEPIDLTNKSDEEVLRVFQLMGPEDNIIVTKDDAGNVNLKDGEKEYMIVGESEEDQMEMDETEEMDESWDSEEMDESIDDIVAKVFDSSDDEEEEEEEYEEMEEQDMMGDADIDDLEDEEIVYEIEFNESEEEEEDDEEEMEESENMMESKMKIKPKGVGMGSPKFKYNAKPNMTKGFKETMKQGPKSVGTGKAKFEYKEGENMKGKMKPVKGVKKMETKESSRTLGAGSMFRKGGLPKPRAHSKFNTAIKESENSKELQILREKNEEYRKALNVFRNKLNEVAVFNSNLAYATRLFTEHSTSKQEKINILRRFDGVETIKESKGLYQSIKDELSVSTSKPMNESVERTIEKNVSTGSAVNLIESKTYENPQFLRMKDLMGKLK
jgi:hypothetical protein